MSSPDRSAQIINFLGNGLLGLSLKSWRGESTPEIGSSLAMVGVEASFMVEALLKLMLEELVAKPVFLPGFT